MSDWSLPYATSTCTVGFMYLFLPALTPILVLITCTQRNTTPYVVVCGVELFSDTFTVYIYSTSEHLLSWCLIAVIASLAILHTFRIVLVGIDKFLIFMDANERSMSLLPTNFKLARSKLMQDGTLM